MTVLRYQPSKKASVVRPPSVPHRLAWALATCSLLTLQPFEANAQVLPSSPNVVSGQATFSTSGNTMRVDSTSTSTIVNWGSFSIGAQNGVHFQQPDATSRVLNRVVGSDPSQIYGQLSSNGHVWLLNPNGVLFGPNARIDVAGLVASTLRLNDQEWLAGRYSFNTEANDPQAAVVNQGELRTTFGGRVVLVGHAVRNEGSIEAPGGQVLLAAADSVELIDTGAPNLSVRISATQGEAYNDRLGRLVAGSGHVDLHGHTVNQQGLVQASGFESGPGGEVRLIARATLELGTESQTLADGRSGGTITLDAGAGGHTLVQGGTTSARGDELTGGTIHVMGSQVGVGLSSDTRLDVSGQSAAGMVRIGGTLDQTTDQMDVTAYNVYLGEYASIVADAAHGKGGDIFIAGNGIARTYGSLSARGGDSGAGGGVIEVYTGGWLDVRPARVDTTALAGPAGVIKLSSAPDIEIAEVGNSTLDPFVPGESYGNSDGSAIIRPSVVGQLLSSGNNVGIDSHQGSVRMVSGTIRATAGERVRLEIVAQHDLWTSGSTIESTGPLDVRLETMTGSIDLSTGWDQNDIATPTRIHTAGGDVSLKAVVEEGSMPSYGGGEIRLTGAQIDAGAGAVELQSVGDISINGSTISAEGGGLHRQVSTDGAYSVLDGGSVFLHSGRNLVTHGTSIAAKDSVVLQSAGAASLSGTSVEGAGVSILSNGLWVDSTSIAGVGHVSLNSLGATALGAASVEAGGNVSLAAYGAVALETTYVHAGRRATISGESIQIGAGTEIVSESAGDAIVLSGNEGASLRAFWNQAGAAALSSPNGRWIVYATDVTDQESFSPGTLAYDFKRYGAAYGDWAGDPGNGLVFSAAQTAQVRGYVGNKVYDGTRTASELDVTAGGVLQDRGYLRSGATGSFDDKNAGTAKPVSFNAADFEFRDADNKPVYGYRVESTLKADIEKAQLSYVADPAERTVGSPIGDLSGSLHGFQGDDNQANATQGTMSFTTPATPHSPAGRYPIEGGGLTAQNYAFTQAEGNETALHLTDQQPPHEDHPHFPKPVDYNVFPLDNPVPRLPIEQGFNGIVNLTGPTESSGKQMAANFGPQRLDRLSPDELLGLLEARKRRKKELFADAIHKLEEDPALADLRSCTSLQDAAAGDCRVTEELKREWRQAEAPAPLPLATAAGPAAVAAAQPKAKSLPGKRKVRVAALPQIARKVAVVIGVATYDDKSIPALANSVRDAQAVGRQIETELGYETILMENPRKSELVATLNKLALELQPQDSLAIYYAGHGELIESTKMGYWQLADSDAKKPETWLSNADITRLLAQISASQVALISDSCYSGSLVGQERLRAAPGGVDAGDLLQRKSVVIMTSGGNEPVFDEGKQGHSPFAWNLMKTLKGVSSWQVGGHLFERVRFAVAREVPQRPQYGASAAAGHQPGGDYLFEQRYLESEQ